MRLERVIAKDSRRATEQVIEQFGADALIISNQKVNGMTEIVVAVDIDAQPLEDTPINREMDRTALEVKAGSEPDARTPIAQRAEPSLGHLPSAPDDAEPGLASPSAEANFGKLLGQSLASGRASVNEKLTPTPSILPFKGTHIPDWLSAGRGREDDGQKHSPEHHPSRPHEEQEADRARELVDMVREELASMRREMALSRQMVAYAATRRIPPELQPIADAFEQSEVPIALRSLLLDEIAQCSNSHQAIESMRTALRGSIKTHPKRAAFQGVHVIAGPSGSGKTHMACRMAAAHAGRRGSESVALISFADQRIGAWTQVQMLAARSGIDSFKVSDAALLGPLLSELSNRELVIIDTAAPAWQGSLAIISECAPAAKMHLLLPADASASTIRRFQSPGTGAWESLMLSKLDESTHSWPVIQALCNQEFALSLGSHDGSPEASAREIEVSELIERALAQCPGLPAEPAPQTAQAPRARRTSARKQTKDVRHAA